MLLSSKQEDRKDQLASKEELQQKPCATLVPLARVVLALMLPGRIAVV